MIPPIGGQLAAANLIPALPVADAGAQAPGGLNPQAGTGRSRNGDHEFTQTAGGPAAAQPPAEAPKSSLEKALESVNDSLKAWSTGLRFDTDDDTHHLVVSIVDSATGEVLRKIPSDAMLRVAKMIVQFQGGGVDTEA